MSDPVSKGNASTRPQHAVRLGQGTGEVGYMEQRFLTYDRIVASVGQWQGGHVALDNLDLAVQANTPCQLRSTRNSRRRQFDTGDKCTIAVRQVTGWAAESGAQVNDLGARAYMRALGQCIVGGDAAIVVLIVREQFVRT